MTRSRSRRRGASSNSMRLAILFSILVGINIYVFFFRGGTSIKDVMKISAMNKKSSLIAPDGKSAVAQTLNTAPTIDDSIVILGTMKGHLGLSAALASRKIDGAQAAEIIRALSSVLELKALRAEHSFEIRLDPRNNKVRQFVYKLSPISSVVATRAPSGTLLARRQDLNLQTKVVEFGGRVDSSLNQSMSEAGENSALVSMFIDLFSWDVNWYVDPREGDEYRVVVEKKFLDGKFYSYGRILSAEYKGKVGRFQAHYYQPEGEAGDYFTSEGRSIRRSFLKMPLNFRRISSRFNKNRFHPVLHKTKGHFGVDYAATVGTPVYAASDGVVVSAARAGGAGNMVVLSHSGGMATMYMHLSKFARGLTRGQKVKQRQTIGFVGSTGLSTGPHLHYAIRSGGKYVDPLTFSVGKGLLLGNAERLRFLDKLPAQLARLEKINVPASGATAALEKKAKGEDVLKDKVPSLEELEGAVLTY